MILQVLVIIWLISAITLSAATLILMEQSSYMHARDKQAQLDKSDAALGWLAANVEPASLPLKATSSDSVTWVYNGNCIKVYVDTTAKKLLEKQKTYTGTGDCSTELSDPSIVPATLADGVDETALPAAHPAVLTFYTGVDNTSPTLPATGATTAKSFDITLPLDGVMDPASTSATTYHIIFGGVVASSKLSDNAVTSSKLATGAVTSTKLATNGVPPAAFDANAISTRDFIPLVAGDNQNYAPQGSTGTNTWRANTTSLAGGGLAASSSSYTLIQVNYADRCVPGKQLWARGVYTIYNPSTPNNPINVGVRLREYDGPNPPANLSAVTGASVYQVAPSAIPDSASGFYAERASGWRMIDGGGCSSNNELVNSGLNPRFYQIETNTSATDPFAVVNAGIELRYAPAAAAPAAQPPYTPEHVSPADGSFVLTATPTLKARFNDPNQADTGQLNFQVCTDPACGTIIVSGSSASGIANGSSGTWVVPGGSLLDGGTYYWRVQGQDNTGLTSSFSADTPTQFKVSTTPPSLSLALVAGTNPSCQSITGTTVYFNPSTTNAPSCGSGSFTVQATVSDAKWPLDSITFPALGTNWTGSGTVNGPSNSPPTVNQTYSWAAGAGTKSPATVTLYSTSSRTATANFDAIADPTAPTGGTISYVDGSITTGPVALSGTYASDSGAGMNGGTVERRSVSVSGSSCGAGWGAWGTLTTIGVGVGAWSYNDSTVANATCYQYRYVATDKVANAGTFTTTATVQIGSPPSNTVAPVITDTNGAPLVDGDTVSTDNGTWTPTPSGYTYAWDVCGYKGVIQQDNPVGYWRLGEPSGWPVAVDESGNANGGWYTGSPTLGAAGALSGDSNTAATFAAGKYLTVPAASSLNVGDSFTLEAWVKRAATGVTQRIFDKGANGFELEINANNKIDLGQTGVGVIAWSTTTIADTNWHYIAATKTGSTVHLYIDGTDVTGAITNSTVQNTTDPLWIGHDAVNEDMTGSIDDAAVYATALTTARIIAHYQAGNAGTGLCSAISGQTASSLTVAAAQVGSKVRSEVTAASTSGSATAMSAQSSVVQAIAPGNTSVPTISDVQGNVPPVVGDQLNASAGVWTGSSPSYSYQWQRCDASGGAVLSDAPAGFWRLNEPNGAYPNATDMSGNARDGAYIGSPAYGASGPVPSSPNGAIQLNGSTQAVSMPAVPISGDFTLEAWVNLAGPGSSGATGLAAIMGVDVASNGSPPVHRLLVNTSTGQLVAALDGTSFSSTSNISLNAWHLVDFVYTGTQESWYIDGTAAGSQAASGLKWTQPFKLGAFDMYNYMFNGKIADAAVYDTALSAARIGAHFSAASAYCSPIAGAIGPSYTVQAADAGTKLKVAVTGANPAGNATVASAASGVIATAAPTVDTVPTVSGTVKVGQALTTSAGSFSGSPTMTKTYAWQRCGYGAALRADSPISWWRLDEPSGGTAADQLGLNNGTYVNTTLGKGGALALDGDTSAAFNGTSSIVTTSFDPSPAQTANFSIEAWVRQNVAPASQEWVAGTNGSAQMNILTNGDASISFFNGTSFVNTAAPTSVTDGNWHYLAGTWDGTTLKMYVDGALANSSAPGSTPVDNSGTFSIGAAANSTQWLSGEIDEVAVYSTALPLTSIQNHWVAATQGCLTISGQNGSSYTPTSADWDGTVRSKITATNGSGSAAAASQPSAKIVPPPANLSTPTTSGILLDGQPLTSTNGTWTNSPTFAYRWQRCTDYAATVMGDGPVGYWRLGEASGTTAVDSAGGNSGTYTSTALGAASPLVGCDSGDRAASFNGSSSYVSVPDTSSLSFTNNTFSLEAWVKTTSNAEQWIATKWNGTAYEYALRLFPVSGTVRAGFTTAQSGNVSNDYVNGTTVLSDGNWHYIVGTADGSNLRVYVDGNLEGTVAMTKTMVDTTTPFEIGRRDTGDMYVNGSIDEVAVYPTTLSAAQITAHYTAGRSVFADIPSATGASYTTTSSDIGSRIRLAVDASTNGGIATAYTSSVSGDTYRARVLDDQPQRYWRLGETSGTTAYDETTNENGTYGNSPTLGASYPLNGSSNTAATFNGSTQYMTGSAPASYIDKFTLEGWVKTSFVPGASNQTIIGSLGSYGQLQLGLNTSAQPFVLFRDNPNWYTVTGPRAINDGAWHFVAGTFDGTTERLYVDGAQVSSAPFAGLYPAGLDCPWQIGGINCAASGYSGQYLNGSLDDIAVYDHALTAVQVYKQYKAASPAVVYGHAPAAAVAPAVSATKTQVGVAATTSTGTWTGNPTPTTSVQWQRCGEQQRVLAYSPWQYWRLGEAYGTTAGDSSGNSHSGVYTGGVTLGQPGALANDASTAVTFNGTNAFVDGSTVIQFDAGNFSITGWFKTSTSTGYQEIWNSGYNGGNQDVEVVLTPGAALTFYVRDGSATTANVVAPGSYADGNWHFFGATRVGNVFTLYADGKVVGTATVALGDVDAASVGSRVGDGFSAINTHYFNGSIDDVAAFMSGLTGGQIQAIYRSGLGTGGCQSIAGATSTSYTPVSADINSELRSTVTGTNSAGVYTKASNWTPTVLPSFSSTIAGDNPNAWYRLGETSGTSAADSSGHGYTGTYIGGVTLNAPGAIYGDSNGAARFDGSTGYVNLPIASVTQGGGSVLSFEGWVKRSSATSGAVIGRNDSGNYTGYQFAMSTSTGTLYMRSHTGTADQPSTATMPTDGQWHYYAGTYDGTCNRSYVDGQLINTNCFGGPTAIPTTGSNAWIDRDPAFQTLYLNADIDEVATYSYTLSASQIRSHWNAGAPPVADDILPAITGTAQDGQTLTASTGTWRGVLPITYTYQWKRCDTAGANCVSIASATSSTYALTPADVGSTIRVAVTATDNPGSATATSAQTGTVAALPPSNTVAPSLVGTAQIGQQLVADNGTWTGTPPINYTYQWQRCGYQQAVSADNPAGWWRMGDASGTTLSNEVAAGSPAITSGSVALGQAGATGDGNTAVNFTGGTASAANYGSSGTGLNPYTAMTMEFWYKGAAPASGNFLFVKPYTSYSEPYYQWGVNGAGGNIRAVFYTQSTFAQNLWDTGVAWPTDGAWHYYAITYDSTTHTSTLYVDGAQRAQSTTAITGTMGKFNTDLAFMNVPSYGAGSIVQGQLDDVAIYDSALSSTRVSAHYTAATSTGCSDISGATAQAYTVDASDAKATIRAKVIATNGGGSVSAYTPVSSTISGGAAVTASGNEITDAVRSADLQGDGRLTTNLNANGGFEVDTSGWFPGNSATIARQTGGGKYGDAYLHVTIVNGDAGAGYNYTVTAGQPYTFSFWARSATAHNLSFFAGASLPNFAVPGGNVWTRYSTTFTPASSGLWQAYIGDAYTPQGAGSFDIDGVQLERGSSLSKYVDTNGTSAAIGADSSFGIWSPSTNLIPNGGAEGGGVPGDFINNQNTTAGRQNPSNPLFGSLVFQATAASCSGCVISDEWRQMNGSMMIAVNAGSTYTFSLFERSASSYGTRNGTLQVVYYQADGSTQTGNFLSTSASITTDWNRLTLTTTAPANSTQARLIWQGSPAQTGEVYWFDGVQFENTPVATPYIETVSSSASRGNPGVTFPMSLISGQQGWMAFRVRPGWDAANAATAYPTLLSAAGSGGDYIQLYYDKAAKDWSIQRVAGASNQIESSGTTQTFSTGSLHTVVFRWSPTGIGVSVDGGAFSSLAVAQNANLDNATFRIGDKSAGLNDFNGDILWATGGTGWPSAADAATLNTLGNNDPALQTASGNAQTSFAWSADTTAYLAAISGTLTATGTPMTDAVRVSSFTSGSRDGLAPESSYGIWPASTNLLTNGGFESGTSLWYGSTSGYENCYSTIARTNTTSKFGAYSLQVTSTTDTSHWTSVGGPCAYAGSIYGTTIAASPNTTYSASVWVKGTAPQAQLRMLACYGSSACDYAGGATTVAINASGWTHLTLTGTTPATAGGGAINNIMVGIGMAGSYAVGSVMYLDGVQLEQIGSSTPYIETSSGTASRAVSYMTTPAASSFAAPPTGTQGWFAFRYRPEFSAGGGIGSGSMLASWDKDSSNYIEFGYTNASKTFWLARANAGATGKLDTAAQTFTAGQTLTVIGAWTGTQLKISVNGGAFTTLNDTHTVAMGATPVVFGAWGLGSGWALNGEILWSAWGTGTLSDADAATVDGYGANDPMPWTFPASAEATMTWAANTGAYYTR